MSGGAGARPRAPGTRGAGAPGEVEEPPPILGRWRRLYALVLANLALLVALFYLFTRAFA